MGKSITTQDWKDHLYTYYRTHGTEDNVKALDSIDWNVRPSSVFQPVSKFLDMNPAGLVVRRGRDITGPNGIRHNPRTTIERPRRKVGHGPQRDGSLSTVRPVRSAGP